jgi:hypothetical protein
MVIGTTNDREIATACEQHRFGVAVIGHAASPEKKRALGKLFRSREVPGADGKKDNSGILRATRFFPASNL